MNKSCHLVSVCLIMLSDRLFAQGLVYRAVQQQRSPAMFHSTSCHRSSMKNEQDPTMQIDDCAEQTSHCKIRWLTASDTSPVQFEAVYGETLRTAALKRGLVSPHNGRANLINCRGLGTCGTCAVEIEGQVVPVERNKVESLRLALPPHDASTNLRLACQVQIYGDLIVTKRTGFWGQGQEMAEKSLPTKPLGDLEYLLDTKSPPDKMEQPVS